MEQQKFGEILAELKSNCLSPKSVALFLNSFHNRYSLLPTSSSVSFTVKNVSQFRSISPRPISGNPACLCLGVCFHLLLGCRSGGLKLGRTRLFNRIYKATIHLAFIKHHAHLMLIGGVKFLV